MSKYTDSMVKDKLPTLGIKDRLRMIILIADGKCHVEISQLFRYLCFWDNDTVIKNYDKFFNKLSLSLIKIFDEKNLFDISGEYVKSTCDDFYTYGKNIKEAELSGPTLGNSPFVSMLLSLNLGLWEEYMK